MTLDQLVEHSTNIIVGRCAATESVWNSDRTQIVTVAHYDVAEDLQGELTGSVDVEALGGEVGEVGMYVPGMPSFSPGHDDVLFLAARSDGRFEVVGMAQGQFRISFPSASAAPVVDCPLEGLELQGSPDGRLERQNLSRFVRTIRDAVN
jgi:hypothetical protein